jgi:hypothetical protein
MRLTQRYSQVPTEMCGGAWHRRIGVRLLSSHPPSKNIQVRIYKIIILPVILYGCETWSLILREEHRRGRIFELTRDEIIGRWRNLHNEELHNLYSSPSVTRMMM